MRTGVKAAHEAEAAAEAEDAEAEALLKREVFMDGTEGRGRAVVCSGVVDAFEGVMGEGPSVEIGVSWTVSVVPPITSSLTL